MTDEDNDWYCCDDDWSVWRRFETWVWAALLLVQLSMVAFLVTHGRKDKSFRQAFYVFFIAVTLVDCALALLRPSREGDETIFGTVYDKPFIDQQYPLLPYLTVRGTLNKIVVHAVVPALGHAQPLFLTAIAVNRFTAFAFPLKHASMWRTQTVVVVTTSLVAMSAILGAACPVIIGIHQNAKCSRATKEQRWELDCDGTWAYEQILIPTALITFTSAICCIVSFLLNVGSIAMLIALRTSGRMQRRGPELQLFAHSLWMFLLQLLLAFQDVVFIADNPEVIGTDLASWDVRLWDAWAYYRHSSEWLAGVNATRKWNEAQDGYPGWHDFTPGCAAPGYWGEESLPTCNTWYLLLIGVLRLRDGLWVRTLEQCLFALSGSVFLLLISANVRTAYLKFYFKWQCLRKNRAHNKVNVITVTARGNSTPSVTTTTTLSTSTRL